VINTKKRVFFYDKEKIDHDYELKEILFENKEICLCKVIMWGDREGHVLFDKTFGEILTKELQFYYATNKQKDYN